MTAFLRCQTLLPYGNSYASLAITHVYSLPVGKQICVTNPDLKRGIPDIQQYPPPTPSVTIMHGHLIVLHMPRQLTADFN